MVMMLVGAELFHSWRCLEAFPIQAGCNAWRHSPVGPLFQLYQDIPTFFVCFVCFVLQSTIIEAMGMGTKSGVTDVSHCHEFEYHVLPISKCIYAQSCTIYSPTVNTIIINTCNIGSPQYFSENVQK